MDNPKCLSWWIADSNMWKKLHDEVSAELDRVRMKLDASREQERTLKCYVERLEKECDEWERSAEWKAAAEEEAKKWLRIADTNAKARDKWEATAGEWQAAAGVWKAAAKKKDATKKEVEEKLKKSEKDNTYWRVLLERVLNKAGVMEKEIQSKNDRIAKLEEWLVVFLGIKK